MKSRQETFDIVFAGLARQGWRQAITPGGACRYRMDGSYAHSKGDPNQILRCAAGQLFDAETYRTNFEGQTTTGGGEVENTLIRLGYDPFFVRECQIVHDGDIEGNGDSYTFLTPDELQAAFVEFANKQGLTIPDVVEVDPLMPDQVPA